MAVQYPQYYTPWWWDSLIWSYSKFWVPKLSGGMSTQSMFALSTLIDEPFSSSEHIKFQIFTLRIIYQLPRDLCSDVVLHKANRRTKSNLCIRLVYSASCLHRTWYTFCQTQQIFSGNIKKTTEKPCQTQHSAPCQSTFWCTYARRQEISTNSKVYYWLPPCLEFPLPAPQSWL